MLSYIHGPVVHIFDSKLTVTPEGIGLGYEVLCPVSVLSMVRIGESVELFLHHHITDVSQTLFGFGSADERLFFRKLLKVDGVGGKTALSLLNLGMRQLVLAIEKGDEKVLSGANGVGKKTALKIIVELKKELSGDMLFADEKQVALAPPHHVQIIDTLVGMGYDKATVQKTVSRMPDSQTSLQDQVVWAIKQL
jgi:Holliday junction DNA helicase RuvA